MASRQDITAMADEIGTLIRDRLGIGGRDLSRQLRRTGRLLPRGLRSDAAYLARAAQLAAHPKLDKQIDHDRVETAFRLIRDHLRAVDRKDRRRGRIIGIATVVVFNLIVLVGLTLAFLRWRGLI